MAFLGWDTWIRRPQLNWHNKNETKDIAVRNIVVIIVKNIERCAHNIQ